MKLISWGMLFLLGLVWSGSFFFHEILLPEVAPTTIVFHRVFIASIVITIVAWLEGKPFPRNPRLLGFYFLMGLTNAVMPYCAIVWGQQFITGGLAAIVNSNTAFASIIIAALFLRDEALTARKLIGVCLGIGGVVVAVGVAELMNLSASNLGQHAVLLASFCYAISTVAIRKWGGEIDPTMAVVVMFWAATIWMAVVLWLVGGTPLFPPTAPYITSILCLAVLSTGLAYVLYFLLIKQIGAGSTTMVTILIPPMTILMNGVLLDEAVTANQLLGFVLIACGLFLAVRGLDRHKGKV